jgi:5'-3' exoribonuclease 1
VELVILVLSGYSVILTVQCVRLDCLPQNRGGNVFPLPKQLFCGVIAIKMCKGWHMLLMNFCRFYPYHYAPFVSDVKGFGDLQIEFELGEPFLPFQQLLGVLPPASKILLPRPFQGLMMNDDSPIKDYYPVEFHTDLNGKEQEWEAVVLIPFIDEERLLAAMREKENQLTKEEVRRNRHGTCHLYRYDSEMEPFTHPSPWPQAFPDVPHSKVRCTELPAIPFPISRSSLVSGLLPGAKLDILFPGFPSLKHVDHSAHLERRGVRVFQAASRDENMCLSVRPKPKDKNLQILASELVGRQCYVGWPYLTESKVHAVSDGVMRYTADPLGRSKVNILSHTLKEKEVVQWNADTTQVSRHYAEFRGIDIPPIEVLVYANVLQGKRYVSDKQNKGTLILHKEWKSFVEPHPYDLSVIDITTHAPEYREKGITLEDMFRPKDPCFMLSNPHYGFQAEILSVDQAQVRVQVKVRLLPEPDIAGVVSNSHRLSVRYLPSFVVARELGLNSLLLSRISGNIQVEKGSPENAKEREKISIGLNLKFERRNKEMPGYCRRTTEGWAYSPAAIGLVKSYMREFPAAFGYLQGNPKADKYYESELMPANAEDGVTLAKVQEWLKKQPVTGINTVDCGGQSLDEPQIAAVERAVSDMKKQKSKSVTVARLRVKPSVLFLPSINQGAVVPDPKAEYFLYDRVINVMPHSAVPFGLKGTIVGIRGGCKYNYTVHISALYVPSIYTNSQHYR